MVSRFEAYRYYNQDSILERIVEICKDREISGTLETGNYTTRPNVIQYPRDVLEMIKKGVVAFHGSVERWRNPMMLSTKLS